MREVQAIDRYEKILEAHNCKLIAREGCRILWENPKGTRFFDDQSIISLMPESAWEFWCEQEVN